MLRRKKHHQIPDLPLGQHLAITGDLSMEPLPVILRVDIIEIAGEILTRIHPQKHPLQFKLAPQFRIRHSDLPSFS